MIFKKSVKQFLRTPGKLLLFILLFAVAAFFLCTGAMLWARNRNIIKQYERSFVTVGTVQQVPTDYRMEKTSRYDSCEGVTERWRSHANYGETLLPEALDFDGADYIVAPEQRPYYGAWCPDLDLIDQLPYDGEWQPYADDPVVEFTVLDPWADGEPINVRINTIFDEVAVDDPLINQGNFLHAGDVVQYHDHYNPDPMPVEQGKTYIGVLRYASHNHLDPDWMQTGFQRNTEYQPSNYGNGISFSSQYSADGTPIDDGVSPMILQEVIEGFYDTEDGQRWLAYSAQITDCYKTLPVIPTGGTELLPLFYNKVASLVDGEDITAEEYAEGAYVCLVSDRFADRNGLTVGDTLRLPLYYANYDDLASDLFLEHEEERSYGEWCQPSVLDAQGQRLEVFSDHEYVIRSIYTSPTTHGARFNLGANAVIVPSASVRESCADNIIGYGRMTDQNTSFQIANGDIERFSEAWAQQGIEDLRITFHDRGFSQVQRGLQNMKRTSTLFLAIGGAMTLALLLFFCNLFITKNKPRTAVERMLGYTKRQCATSLLAGFLLAAVLATAVGCGAGARVERKLSAATLNKEYFATDFTLGQTERAEIDVDTTDANLFCPVSAAALLAVTFVISKLFMAGNLKEEPLLMSGQKNE